MKGRGRSLGYACLALAFAALFALAAHALKTRARGGSEGRAEVAPEGLRIGAPIAIENLTLFPLFNRDQTDPGPMTTLAEATAKGLAEVRELGSSPGAEEQTSGERPVENRRHGRHGFARQAGATVNTLEIVNNGDTPIYVLAGTVVKGGNQDRQIGQDFVVGAKSRVPVDAFCVEHGRWRGDREGADTQGKFVPVEQLASSKVRAAGQHESNQSEVWAEVAKVNSANGKQAASGTLLATLDDATLKAQRSELAKRIDGALAKADPEEELVGMAYAVDGRVRGVRWFASTALFGLFRGTLVNTAASDAITARGGAAAKPAPPMAAADVSSFLREVEAAKSEEKATPADNVNRYKKAKVGYGSSTEYRPKAGSKKAVPLSSDYVAK